MVSAVPETSAQRPPLRRLSVVIPVFEQPDELEIQLRAVLAQEAPLPYEVVVADNGSRDTTPEVIRRWEQADDRVRGVNASARRGPAAARNLGVAAADGDVLAFCDADDVVAPGWLAGFLEVLPDADLVAGLIDFGSLNGTQDATPREYYTAHFGFLPAGLGANLAIRREAFDQLDGFDETLRVGEDIDLCWRAQLAGLTYATARTAVVAKRERADARARRRQLVSYGRHDVELYRRFRSQGMRRDDLLTLKTYVWLVVNAPLAVLSRSRRMPWSGVFFLRLGRLLGSLALRVRYP